MRTLRSSRPASPTTSMWRPFEGTPPAHGERSGIADASVGLRLRVWLTRGRLDRQIAAGRSCEATQALALRARQLAGHRTRRRVADSLRGVVEEADRRASPPLLTSVVIEQRAVRFGRLAILDLAEQLDGERPVDPRGVVLARTLLTDGLSPLFNMRAEQTVTEAASEAMDALATGLVMATHAA